MEKLLCQNSQFSGKAKKKLSHFNTFIVRIRFLVINLSKSYFNFVSLIRDKAHSMQLGFLYKILVKSQKVLKTKLKAFRISFYIFVMLPERFKTLEKYIKSTLSKT